MSPLLPVPDALTRRRALSLFAASAAVITASGCNRGPSASPGNKSSGAPSQSAQPPGAPAPADPVELSGSREDFNAALILLGTGAGPLAAPGRGGTSSVLIVGERPYLIDAGPWSSRKLALAGISSADLGGAFITHMHNDHIADLFNVFWLPGVVPGYTIKAPIPIFGPGSAGGLPGAYQGKRIPIESRGQPVPSLSQMLENLQKAYAYEINIRNTELATQVDFRRWLTVHDVLPPRAAGASITATAPDMEPFDVFEDDRVKVSATLVPHGPVFPSFAYRFDFEAGSVAFSGDTAKSDNVSRLANGADVLVHEVTDIDFLAKAMPSPELVEHIAQTHTTAADVGRVATAAGVRKVVLNHIGPGDPRAISDDVWSKGVQRTFDGDVVVGHDMVQMGVGSK